MNMSNTRKVLALALAAAIAFMPVVAPAQQPAVIQKSVDSVSGSVSAVQTDSTCILVKYKGTTTGLHSVEVASGGDITFKIAGVADTTTGSPNLDGIFDLSTPAGAVDTMGELVTLINTTGSNWNSVLVDCLAADLTNNTIFTLSAADANAVKGVALIRDETVASATSVFSAQTALLPAGMDSDIRFFLSGAPPGATTGSTKVNPNPFANYQTFVQAWRENITSSGTVALFAVLAVSRTYSSNGTVTDVVRPLYNVTGAASTSELAKDFQASPLVTAPGEMVIVRQRTATALTVAEITGIGYMFRK
jgi:hypothetical protein